MTEYTPHYRRATRLVTSRRVKHEESLALRQAALFGVAAVVLLVVTLLVVIPGVIRLFGSFSGVPDLDGQDTVIPQIPHLSAPVDATFSATINLSGFTTPKAKVFILKNGQEEKQLDADDSGSFATSMSLSDGENRFSAYASNGAGESATSEEFITVFDNEEPKIEISEPIDGQTIQGKLNQMVTIKGKTEPSSRVYLNDRLVFAREDGEFSTTHRLENGKNDLAFRVLDRAGNQSEKTISVNFQE
jgi:hypothetical protein